jgi:hypothetical protein
MSSDQAKEGSRSISVGGNVIGSALITGDHNVVNVNYRAVSLPTPDDVDMCGELQALREIIGQIESGDRQKIDNAFADVDEELRGLFFYEVTCLKPLVKRSSTIVTGRSM